MNCACRRSVRFNAAIVVALATAFASGQPDAPAPPPTASLESPSAEPSSQLTLEDPWRADATMWLWLVGMSGTTGIGETIVDVDASFGDILDGSDSIFAFSGRLEVGKGRWGGFIDGMYSALGAEDQSGPLGLASVDVSFDMLLVDFGVMYRLCETDPSGSAALNRRDMSLDLYAGGRYTDISLELDPALAASRSRDVSWLDPIVGAKFILPVAEKWRLEANGDIGGFGVSSDFTWSATAVIAFDFRLFDCPASFYAGYRAIGQDYTDDGGSEDFVWDLVQHGPIIGLSLDL